MKEITDNSTGISTSAIKNCDDREQLLQWKLEINDAITEIKSAIEANFFNDESWLSRASYSKTIKIRLRSYIDFRLGVVNRMMKEQNMRKAKLEHDEWLKLNKTE